MSTLEKPTTTENGEDKEQESPTGEDEDEQESHSGNDDTQENRESLDYPDNASVHSGSDKEAYEEVVFEYVPVNTQKLEGYEKALHHLDIVASSLQLLLGKVTSQAAYTPRTPQKINVFAYFYDGDEEMNVDVGFEAKSVMSIPEIPPEMVDGWTQVHAVDILNEFKVMMEKKELEDIEKGLIPRVPSKQADAFILTRPKGYKELELSMPMDAVTFEAQTQVTDHQIDLEYAMRRGTILLQDDILWPTVGEFDMDMVSRRLQDYIKQCWALDPKWMYHIHPLQTITDDIRKKYLFEAKFSVPTPLNPIPQATASVFFIFEISHYAPKDEVVKMHYVVEGTRFQHCPGNIPFQDKWLWAIIADKIRIQRSINF